jgi:WD40 repeat protein
VHLWDVTDRERPAELVKPLGGHTGSVWALALSPDASILASAGADSTVRLWEVADPRAPHLISTLPPSDTSPVNGLAYAHDGHTLAVVSDVQVTLWDLADRAHPARRAGQVPGVEGAKSVAFSPDGKTLALAAADGSLGLWPIAGGPVVRFNEQPVGRTAAVNTLAFAPDGKTLASGGAEQNIQLWDIADPRHPAKAGTPLTGFDGPVETAVYAADGTILATAGDDQMIRLWTLPPANQTSGDPVRTACTRAGGGLDQTAWQRYAPGVPYRQTCP